MLGRIHSIESCGTVDGPGVRYVVFLQGCPLRCQYCHNPDTWDVTKGMQMSVKEILDGYEKVKNFLKNGGLTVTGGEPLLQLEFVTELMEEAKKRGIHTCIDTSGITFRKEDERGRNQLERLMAATDLFLLDLKAIHDEKHVLLTGQSNQNVLAFAQYLSDAGKDVWIRHVVVPYLTYEEQSLKDLGYFIGGLRNVKALDVLPYHTMGTVKYEAMGIEYPLKGVDALEKEDAIKARGFLLSGMIQRMMEKKESLA